VVQVHWQLYRLLLVISHGVEYLFACIVLLGIIQILFGVFKLGKLINLVSPAVMNGFVNGLAIVIFMAQFKDFPINDGPEFGIMVSLIGLTIVGILWAPIKYNPTKFVRDYPNDFTCRVWVS